MKFGGTSVADAAAIERLMSIVRAERQVLIQPESVDWRGPLVVVSALSGVTDRLLGVAAEAGAGDAEGARKNLRDLRERHHTVARVIAGPAERASVDAAIDREFEELERIVGALAVLREVSPRWLDVLAASGEILSSQIVAAALTTNHLSARWVDARVVMKTNAEHGAAAPLLDETRTALERVVDPILRDRRIPVMGGFVGSTLDGVTTTLGRGGSDYSAAVVGACFDAHEIQIWTDVDGMLTADPRIVKNPRVVSYLSFAEASELAYFGAKVLHPATIQPAVARNIPVRILNSHRPEARGSLITAARPATASPVTAIASKAPVTVVDITSTHMLMTHGFLRRLFEIFERHGTSVDVVTTSEVSVSVTVDDTRRLRAIIADLSAFAEVSREDDMAIVCVVGEGLQTDPSLVGKMIGAAGDVPLKLVSQAASRRNVTIVVRGSDLATVLHRLHDRFFEPAGVSATVVSPSAIAAGDARLA
jgi:aspartate kinase